MFLIHVRTSLYICIIFVRHCIFVYVSCSYLCITLLSYTLHSSNHVRIFSNVRIWVCVRHMRHVCVILFICVSEGIMALRVSVCWVCQCTSLWLGVVSLQHTATHCNTLQHTATHCNTLQHTATHCNTLQHSATLYNTLQHSANWYSVCGVRHSWNLWHDSHYNTLQHTATHCDTLQHTATNCNTRQHTATPCNTLQHTATYLYVSQDSLGSLCVCAYTYITLSWYIHIYIYIYLYIYIHVYIYIYI